jgi:large subunit ribosomal protein L6
MSRVGKQPIELPQGVEVAVTPPEVIVKGPKGELKVGYRAERITVEAGESTIIVTRDSDEKVSKALHGLTRSLIANAVVGVITGYQKFLDVHGVGFRAEQQGRKLTLHIGYSHTVEYEAPEGVEVTAVDPVGGAQARIAVSGIDKQKVGQVASEIRQKRKPDPYKGKGIRYEGEIIHWKAGKAAVA